MPVDYLFLVQETVLLQLLLVILNPSKGTNAFHESLIGSENSENRRLT